MALEADHPQKQSLPTFNCPSFGSGFSVRGRFEILC
jgi:hypothetical protein